MFTHLRELGVCAFMAIIVFEVSAAIGGRRLRQEFPQMLIPIRTGEPSVMTFVKRAKILATRVYEFFEGGNIDTIIIRQTSLSGEPIELSFPICGNPASIRLLASS
jgi:hypothetical protein